MLDELLGSSNPKQEKVNFRTIKENEMSITEFFLLLCGVEHQNYILLKLLLDNKSKTKSRITVNLKHTHG